MNIPRRIARHHAAIQHRELWYEFELDKLMTGKSKPGDVTLRWLKLKEVRGK